MTKGKHRAPSKLESSTGEFAVAGSAIAMLLAAPVLSAPMAFAETKSVGATSTGLLNEIARCESGNNPNVVNSSGHGGLFQFDAATWKSVGGAGRPEAASVTEQYKRASLLLASRGTQPWLASQECWSKKFSPVKAGTRVTVTSKAKVPTPAPKTITQKAKPSPKPRVKVVPEKVLSVKSVGSYTVKHGDTLSEIAHAKHTTWRSLYLDNQSKINNPDLIYVGQVLVTP